VMPTGAAGLIDRVLGLFRRSTPTATPSGLSAPAAAPASSHPAGGKL
jgi:hypothetical protein